MHDTFWTPQKAHLATGGSWLKEPHIPHEALQGVSIDSRTLKPGDIYVAIKGDIHDGHSFVQQAIDKGARLIIISSEVTWPDLAMLPSVAILQTPDTLKALTNLGLYARHAINCQRIALTGSVGKTGLKDMLSQALRPLSPTWCTHGNYNNHFGVPLTLANTSPSSVYNVLEVGTNNPGEIEPLSLLCAPHIAIITTVVPSHIGHFENFDALVREKASIFQGIEPGGYAILPRDDEHYTTLLKTANNSQASNVITFGYHPQADVRLIQASPLPHGLKVDLFIHGQPMTATLAVQGKHWAYSAAIIASVAMALKLDPETLLNNVTPFTEPAGRGQISKIPVPNQPDKMLTLIDQAYNANPTSVKASLEMLQDRPVKTGRKIAILGDMYELGNDEQTTKYHTDLSASIQPEKLNLLITVGKFTKFLHQTLKKKTSNNLDLIHYDTLDQALTAIPPILEEDDTLMIKSSNSFGLKKLVEHLKKPYEA